MSFKAVAWAWEQRGLTPSQRIVLIGLAQHADKNGDCFPKVSSLADECELSQRAVELATKELSDRGIINVTRRKRQDGSLTSNLYRLNIYAVFAVSGEEDSLEGGDLVSPGGDTDSPLLNESESVIKTVSNEPVTVYREPPAGLERFHEILQEISAETGAKYTTSKDFWPNVVRCKQQGVDIEGAAHRLADEMRENPKRYKTVHLTIVDWLQRRITWGQGAQTNGRNGTNTADTRAERRQAQIEALFANAKT
jgi:hypothetical protein